MNRGRLLRYSLSAGVTAATWAAFAFAILAAAQVGREAAIAAAIGILHFWAVAAILFAPFEPKARRPGPRNERPQP